MMYLNIKNGDDISKYKVTKPNKCIVIIEMDVDRN